MGSGASQAQFHLLHHPLAALDPPLLGSLYHISHFECHQTRLGFFGPAGLAFLTEQRIMLCELVHVGVLNQEALSFQGWLL